MLVFDNDVNKTWQTILGLFYTDRHSLYKGTKVYIIDSYPFVRQYGGHFNNNYLNS